MSNSLPKWTDDRTAQLTTIVGSESPVTAATVETAATTLETTTRSIASKLRKMGVEVVSLAQAATAKKYSESDEAELRSFLEANPNTYTYAEVAAAVLGGNFSAKQIQGKLLSMELFSLVKATPQVETVKQYSDKEEAKILKLVRAGKFMEDIAEALNRPMNSVRGKILSLTLTHDDISIPKQRNYATKVDSDPFAGISDMANMSVEDIATAIDKTARGVKIMLTNRALTCGNYDGAKRSAKLAEAKAG
jgi:hypothetical protein